MVHFESTTLVHFDRPLTRAQLAYQLDLTQEPGALKWLGRQRVSAYGEFREIITAPNSLRYRDQVTDNPDFANQTAILTSNSAHLYPRYFLGAAGANSVQYANSGVTAPDGQYNATYFNTTTGQWNYADPVTINQVYFALGEQKQKIRTDGVALQSFLVKDAIIPTVGVRKDRTYSEDNLPTVTLPNGMIDPTNLTNFGANKRWNSGVTRTKGIVVKPFRAFEVLGHTTDPSRGIFRWTTEALRGLDLFYNESDAFQPADTAYNVFGEQLPNPSGKTREYGFGINLFDDKFSVRVRHYDTKQIHARSSLGVIATRATGMDFVSPDRNRTFNLYGEAQTWVTLQHPTYTPDQVNAAAAQIAGLSPAYVADMQNKTVSDVNDAESKGWELELNYNPTRFWTVKATGSQQQAIDTNLSSFVQQYIAMRMPIWTTVIDPTTGNLWWNESQGSSGIPSQYYASNIDAPLALAITNQGKRKPQTREYSFNLLTKYQLAGVFADHRWLRNLGVGGAVRWSSRAAIGYLAAAPDADGVVRHLDANRPYYDKATADLDLMSTYDLRWLSDRVRTRLQLNVRNATENGHLRPVAVNPDGTVWRYRIIDPRQFILSASFDL